MDKKMDGKFSGKSATSGDLERGYSVDSTTIPGDGDNVFKPGNKGMGMMLYMEEEEKFGEGGFLDRDQCGHTRY